MSSFVDFFSSGDPPSFGNWLELSEIPLAEELTAEHSPKLPLNDFEERHQLKDQYLETQYRLHRYEATEPLRRAIQVYRMQFSQGDTDIELESVNTYTNVHTYLANSIWSRPVLFLIARTRFTRLVMLLAMTELPNVFVLTNSPSRSR